jgi:type IV secretory pathway ATPase VirB11/archaellum biosynthesis ATPase
VFVARDGRHELTTTILTAAEVRDLVERMLKTSGRRVNVSSPFVDAMLPSGHRLHVVLDGITRGFTPSTSASSSEDTHKPLTWANTVMAPRQSARSPQESRCWVRVSRGCRGLTSLSQGHLGP